MTQILLVHGPLHNHNGIDRTTKGITLMTWQCLSQTSVPIVPGCHLFAPLFFHQVKTYYTCWPSKSPLIYTNITVAFDKSEVFIVSVLEKR